MDLLICIAADQAEIRNDLHQVAWLEFAQGTPILVQRRPDRMRMGADELDAVREGDADQIARLLMPPD